MRRFHTVATRDAAAVDFSPASAGLADRFRFHFRCPKDENGMKSRLGLLPPFWVACIAHFICQPSTARARFVPVLVLEIMAANAEGASKVESDMKMSAMEVKILL